MGIITELMGNRFPSLAKLAAEVHARWSEDGTPPIQLRGFASKLSDLENGKTVWWRNHNDVLAHLAAALDATPEELSATNRSIAPAQDTISFREFPELRPLDLRREMPAPIWSGKVVGRRSGERVEDLLAWFPAPSLGWQKPATWIVMPEGAGKSLIVQWHRHRSDVVAKTVARLSDAADELKTPGRLVLEVEEAGGDDDLRLAASLRDDAEWNKLVLAPFALSDSPEPASTFGWEARHGTLAQRAARAISFRWSPVEIPLADDWRRILVDWIAKRLEGDADTLFNAGAFRAWLERFDKSESIVRTPSDMLFFARMLHLKGERWLAKANSNKLLEYVVQSAASLTTSNAVRYWFESHGVAALRSIVLRRLETVAVPWAGPLPALEWQRLASSEHAPSPNASKEIGEALDDLTNATKKSDRERQGARLREALGAPRSAEVIAYLRRERLLVPAGANGLVLSPGWIERLIAIDRLAELQPHDLGTWVRLSTSGDRRWIALSFLERQSDEELVALIRRCATLVEEHPFPGLKLADVLFAHVAKRLEDRIRPIDESHRTLLRIILQRLTARWSNVPPAPALRPGVGENGEQGLEWLADCWSWSLSFEPDEHASELVPDKAVWLFPGWFSTVVPLPPPPAWLGEFVTPRSAKSEFAQAAPPAPIFFRLVNLANGIVDRIGARIFDIEVPEVMLLGAIGQAASADAERVITCLDRIFERGWLRDMLEQRLSRRGQHNEEQLMGALWNVLLLRMSRSEPNSWLRDWSLQDWVFERIPVALFVSPLSAHAKVATEVAFRMPPRLRVALAVWLSENEPSLLERYMKSGAAWGPEDLEGLTAAARHTGPAAQAVIWRHDASYALNACKDALNAGNHGGLYNWVISAPQNELDAIVAMLEVPPTLPRDLRWALIRILPNAGNSAERIFQLLSRPLWRTSSD